MISLVIPPKGQVNLVQKMLVEEMGTATNIKSRVNRQSVLDAIGSAQQRLKLYNKVPPNGLVVYCGAVLTESGKERQMRIDFEPFKPINTSLYMCDNKFHTAALSDLLVNDQSTASSSWMVTERSSGRFAVTIAKFCKRFLLICRRSTVEVVSPRFVSRVCV